MQIKFIPIDYDYFDYQGKNYVKIIGRNELGKRVCVIDSFEPHFWAILVPGINEKKIQEIQKKIEKIKIKSESRITTIKKTQVLDKNYLGKPVKAIKIFLINYKDAHPVADNLGMKEIIARREYDIPLISRYIMDKGLVPLLWYNIEGEVLNNSQEFGGIDSALDVDICIKANKIEKLPEKEQLEFEKSFKPKILAYDIESSEFEIGKGEILMISLYSDSGKFKKVLTCKQAKHKLDYVESFKDEADMLEAFVRHIKEQSPDILVGYFSDGFDLPYLKARAEKNKVRLCLGIDGSQPKFSRGRILSGKINGIVHVDIFRFIQTAYSQYLQSETLGLNEIASELLGEKKKDFDFSNLKKMKESDWSDFFEYNLQDSSLTYKLAEKIWPDMLEFSKIIQEPLFEITRKSMSQLVEYYILHNLEKYNEIAAKRPLHEDISKRRAMKKYGGAFVFEPSPGLYENLVFFDFTSMYASVIVTYNLALSNYQDKKQSDSLEVDLGKEGKVYFSKQKAFFPEMLSEIIEKRKKYKAEYKKQENNLTKARSNAYKLLANAAYGYQGFFGARYYCREAAASTAALAKKHILEAIEKIKKAGFQVIYSDTDSIAFLQDKKSKKQVLEFLKKLNSELPGIMELELEDFYKRGLFVSKRTTLAGAKKKYALINHKGEVKIRGFETVRRDWCTLARELQSKVIGKILKEGNERSALEIVKEKIKQIKNREISKQEILIRTQLKKPISEYKSISPHVIAAQKMHAEGLPVDIGMLIEYYIAETREKKKLVREKVKLPNEKGEYNIKYYLGHQIIPAVENIFEVFNINLKEIAEGKKQMKLGEF